MKQLRLGLILVVLLAGALLSAHQVKTCNIAYRFDGLVQVGKSSILTEVAKTPSELTKGLGNRTCMNADTGMLFEFAQSGQYSFWMKDMRFAIDIIWINSDNRVVKIQSKVLPSTYPHSFVNVQSAQYVLELKAGQVDILGLRTSSTITFKLK